MATDNPHSQTFKYRDASSYDPVTDEYDRFVAHLSPPLVERMISLARLTSADRILDVGTGTGIVALQAAQSVGPSGRVLGVDLSDAMIALATAKASDAGLSHRLDFRKMDAEALDLDECSYDVVLSLFALLHFPNPLAALGEMFRVLRPGGTLVVAVGSGPPLLSLGGLVHRLNRLPDVLFTLQSKLLIAPNFLNALVEREFPEPVEPEESSLARAGSNRTRSVRQLVQRAGFSEVRSNWQGEKNIVDTPEEFWDIQRTFSSIARKRLSQAPAEQVDALRAEFLSKCRAVQSRGGKLVYPFAAYYVSARRAPAS